MNNFLEIKCLTIKYLYMSKPLCKSEFTKIYNRYAQRFNESIGDPVSTGQDLAPAAPANSGGNAGMSEFTTALTNLTAAIGKLKNPADVQKATQALQQMLQKKPGVSNTPVNSGPAQNSNPTVSPPMQANNNLQQSA